MNCPAIVVWDSKEILQIERTGNRLKLYTGTGVMAHTVMLDVDDARAVRRYLSQWIRWAEAQ